MIQQYRRQLNRAISSYNAALKTIKEEKSALEESKTIAGHTETARKFLQEAAEGMQNRAHGQIAGIASKCLSTIFDRPYKLKIKFEQRRGKTEADFIYERDGNTVLPLVTSGGVKDVVSMSLRLASLRMNLPPVRQLLILDEPGKNLSQTNLAKLGRLLEILADELDMQIILTTHSKALSIGRVVSL